MADVVSLVDRQAAARDRLHARVGAFVEREVRSFDRWYSDGEVEGLASRLVTAIEAGQRQTARLTDAYLAATLTSMIGRTVRPVGVQANPGALRGGVDHVAVYTRLGSDYRFRVSEGADPTKAASAMVARAASMSALDMGLAMRDSAAQVFEFRENVVDGYRRVLRPEFSRTGNCELCRQASDRVYGKSDLLPIHSRCRCETLPVVGEVDPALDLNASETPRVNSDAEAEVKMRVAQHGELGPLLVARDQHFEGFKPSLAA